MTPLPEDIERFARAVALSLDAMEGERQSDIDELREEVAALGVRTEYMWNMLLAQGLIKERVS